jgi:UDP-N-acetylglucosamine--N-acetylmuramyl-(pentapeptide) pyrophosphoryl-undecaprenol N-acetylglucosamine transferase
VSNVSFFLAGGGTGGHIYPLLAVTEQILARQPDAGIHFFHSTRTVDTRVFGKTHFARTPLPASGLSAQPVKFLRFSVTFQRSYQMARRVIAESLNPVVIGAGGFVAAPVCRAGHKLGAPVVLLNVDLLPGRANRLSARWADEIFVQFEESRGQFPRGRAAVSAVGCPLRSGFCAPDPGKAREDLGLDPGKCVLLITGASSGSASINDAICRLLPQLDALGDRWQIVHLTGLANYEAVKSRYRETRMRHEVLDYYDHMPDLFAATDLVVGRSGAVSVAEYAVAGVPSICLPYPHHKDRHQYLNAAKLVEAGAAVIVDDLPKPADRARRLWGELRELMTDDEKRRQMSAACKQVARPDAAAEIALRLLGMTREDRTVTNAQGEGEPLLR